MRLAIAAAQDGDTIAIPAGVFHESWKVEGFNGELSIEGAGVGLTIMEPGPSADPGVPSAVGGAVFIVSDSQTVELSGITFRGGNNTRQELPTDPPNPAFVAGRGGGGRIERSTVHLRDCSFENNMSFIGGGLVAEDSGASTISNCSFADNFAQRDGGAILVAKDGMGAIYGCTFTDNTLRRQGFNFVHTGAAGATHFRPGFRLDGTPYNAGDPAMGGEFFGFGDLPANGFDFVPQTVVGPVFEGFYAGPEGGAIRIEGSSTFVWGNVFERNSAYFGGGALTIHIGAGPTVVENDFTGNDSSRGGAIYLETAPTIPTIAGNTFSSNSSVAEFDFPGSGLGGAINMFEAAGPIIRDNDFLSNTASHGGGAVSVYDRSTPLIQNNRFSGNTVTNNIDPPPITLVDGSIVPFFPFGRGGAVEVTDAFADIEGNLFDGNEARLGSGIFTSQSARIVGNTFQSNVPILNVVPVSDPMVFGSAIYLQNNCVDSQGNASTDQFVCFDNAGTFTVLGNQFVRSPGSENLPFEVLMAGINLVESVALQVGTDLFVQSFDNYYKVETTFNEAFYLLAYPDVAPLVTSGAFESAYQHYVQVGQGAGRIPVPDFSEKFYLVSNPDIADLVVRGDPGDPPSGYFHFINFGQDEGRPRFPVIASEFDEAFYLLTYPEVSVLIGFPPDDFESAFDHYFTVGQDELRRPTAAFSEKFYRITNPDILSSIGPGLAFTSGFDHYVQVGRDIDNRPIFPRVFDDCATNATPPCAFDKVFYLTDNPGVGGLIGFPPPLFESAFDHYYHVGQQPNQFGMGMVFNDPNADFDEQCYRASVVGLQPFIDGGTFTSGFDHFLETGRGEGRDPRPCDP